MVVDQIQDSFSFVRPHRRARTTEAKVSPKIVYRHSVTKNVTNKLINGHVLQTKLVLNGPYT